MDQLQVIERGGHRVLTTQQVADAFGVETKQLLRNFQRNSERYMEGKHYYALNGEALKMFKAERQHDDTLKFASSLYLWTEQGAWLHAKSLNNDASWKAYSMLVDDYYMVKSELSLASVAATTDKILLSHDELKNEILMINKRLDEQITLLAGEQRRLQKVVATRVYELESDSQCRPRLFSEIYREIKDRFAVSSYKDVRRKDLQSAISYIEHYIPKKIAM
ncbi:hypothetical protein KZO01_06060 [Kurthia zopfii]|uniref:ORF6C domain-containing protein n=1 Tax=Kurthia zopfii TaxID=1650 RepID=A0A8B4Q888_9BACL|nr:ORF6N domain-containing protein [Kurthia zopfii]PWI23524.1 hypothetical protein DF281_02985 [Kurthia zopfii]TDR35552.1 ORF6C domain-containing protein [Kurthia zopfii]GEK30297.1 hypothetical protein KZO01_06060 [Kurthia zopfii]STX09186.1 ORF6N domain [Kurthia zopfii]